MLALEDGESEEQLALEDAVDSMSSSTAPLDDVSSIFSSSVSTELQQKAKLKNLKKEFFCFQLQK